ncbi:hypothetical protein Tco_0919833 [Tanacetum coccineum]
MDRHVARIGVCCVCGRVLRECVVFDPQSTQKQWLKSVACPQKIPDALLACSLYGVYVSSVICSVVPYVTLTLSKKIWKDSEMKQFMLMDRLQTADENVENLGDRVIQILVRLKEGIAAHTKMYDGDLIHNNKLVIHTTDSEETLEDVDKSQNKMRHKMVQIDYEKLNALYKTFVSQQELFVEQAYFSIPSTSDNGSTSKDVPSESPGPKMPTESRLLTMIDTLGDTIIGFQTRINKSFLQDTERRWLSDSQNKLREFYKTNVILMSRSLYKTLSEIKEELIEEVQEMLNIFVSMEQKVNEKSPTENILENEID